MGKCIVQVLPSKRISLSSPLCAAKFTPLLLSSSAVEKWCESLFFLLNLLSLTWSAFSQVEGSDPDLSSIQIDGSDLEGKGLPPPVPVPLLCSPTHWNSRFSIIFSLVSLAARATPRSRPILMLDRGKQRQRQHLLSWVIGSRRILIKIGPKPVQLTDRVLMRQRQAQIQTSTEF